ncbi:MULTISPECIES: TIGR02450 family Trp-rich protein [unclassified Agarivorans]|uniref:TIGR02450 family Trp-rich protein n=1 Tax=unclassified Agarivorans TaxID=2636026 RepID=UPI0010F7A4B8|nr:MULTISPECIES: TIGR02450 family Trp-rich protein [unclassified Agarivorans]MDO6683925.1 TIGR02450 family Trp-rich protein [Agarivorans sp. 3_MG-2023]MDO6714342.1 TIGR02450 family Trp-rich protein [Agarivorans sp. 2_MG-2023]MDO6762427.1 TIGR02450 family Trp-rich protein [Agarivorans sp. 1_MG-2023]
MKNQINPKRLLHSKWTKCEVINKMKHFMVTELELDEFQVVQRCVIQAVYNKQDFELDWRELKDLSVWRQGWK